MTVCRYDTIIIGAGMSGLAAGIRLSHYDKKVLILEKHKLPGGLNSYYRRNNFNYDVGLHAITNFSDNPKRSAPVSKLLRQLRFRKDEFNLFGQKASQVRFPFGSFEFNSTPLSISDDIKRIFPDEAEKFDSFLEMVLSHEELSLDSDFISSKELLKDHFGPESRIPDILFCPLMYYGNANEHDMDFSQFVIMFKALFVESFARPAGGVRGIIRSLLKKYRANGGEIKFNTGVKHLHTENGRVTAVVLDNGTVIEADRIFSSAGVHETSNLVLDKAKRIESAPIPGKMSFIEVILNLDISPSEMGFEKTIVFFNKTDSFKFRCPDDMVDYDSGVLCCPNNFRYPEPIKDFSIRLTHISNYSLWQKMSEDEYQENKELVLKRCIETIESFIPGIKKHIIETDLFTPLTVERFTGHTNGAVYGSPSKTRRGLTDYENLFIIGTDQGFLGIIGAMLSGVSMANLYGLKN
jgi:phytoene dehydrogenase-like protein